MSRPNYAIPDNPVYNPAIPSLLNEDKASATQTFNPLFSRLIENAHAVKLAADVLQFQVGVLTGHDVTRSVDTHADLPAAAGLKPGTLFVVRSDETRGGKPAIYELNAAGQWVFVGDMGSNLQSQIYGSLAGHNIDPAAHGALFKSLKSDIKLLMYLIQQMQPVGAFLGAGSFLGADDSILI